MSLIVTIWRACTAEMRHELWDPSWYPLSMFETLPTLHADAIARSVIRVIKHDNFEYSFSELQAKNFSSPEWPTHVLSPFPKRPDPGLEIPVCGVQANFIDGGLLLVFCLHHGVADGFWARVVLGVFLGSLAGIKSVVPKRLTYNLEKLEGSLELQGEFLSGLPDETYLCLPSYVLILLKTRAHCWPPVPNALFVQEPPHCPLRRPHPSTAPQAP